MSEIPIKQYNFVDRPCRWHLIEGSTDEGTAAMNVSGGVLVRSIINQTNYDGENTVSTIAMQFVPDLSVVQQWKVSVRLDDVGEKYIEVLKSVYLDRTSFLTDERGHDGSMVIGKRFRRFSADDDMPQPEACLVRAVAQGDNSHPSEIETLRCRISQIMGQLAYAEDQAALYRRQRDHLLGGLSWDLATADNPMSNDEDDDEYEDDEDE